MTDLKQAAQQALEALENERYVTKYTHIVDAITALRTALEQPEQEPVAIDGNTSDGYHTFNELYEFRKAYNVALFNEWAVNGKCSVHKSWRHHDGELCFGGGWFIVVAVLPDGQISNHYEAKDWDLFGVQETDRALFEFDGHTGSDVIARLKAYTTPPAAQWDKPSASFNDWWDSDIMPPANPFVEGTAAYWAWAGWKAAQRPWVGLTDEEVKHEWEVWRASLPRYIGFAQGIEAKLKERNT
jgi:hypothetical protein